MTTVTAKIPLVSIQLTRAEGPKQGSDFSTRTVATCHDASMLLFQWCDSAPSDGSVDKCDFVMLFADQTTYTGQYGLQHWSRVMPDFRKEVLRRLLCSTPRVCPFSRTEDQHRAILERLGPLRIARYEALLDQYEF